MKNNRRFSFLEIMFFAGIVAVFIVIIITSINPKQKPEQSPEDAKVERYIHCTIQSSQDGIAACAAILTTPTL